MVFVAEVVRGHPPTPIFRVCGTEHGSQYPPTPLQALNVALQSLLTYPVQKRGKPKKGMKNCRLGLTSLGATLCVRSGCGPTQGIAPWPDDLAEPPTRTGGGANEPLALVLHPLRSCLLGRTPISATTTTWSVSSWLLTWCCQHSKISRF